MIFALVLLHAGFYCEQQGNRKEYNLSDVKFSVSWKLPRASSLPKAAI